MFGYKEKSWQLYVLAEESTQNKKITENSLKYFIIIGNVIFFDSLIRKPKQMQLNKINYLFITLPNASYHGCYFDFIINMFF